LLLGDFNALRRADYADTRWAYFVEHDAKRGVFYLFLSSFQLVTFEFFKVDALSYATSLIEENDFVDSFAINNVPSPQCTTWSARRVDYIYLNQNFKSQDSKLKVVGSYIYHDTASDHIPVIVDLLW
jgi:endonuclease/exonuclease/phosphatase family metal-dependent hydrolase